MKTNRKVFFLLGILMILNAGIFSNTASAAVDSSTVKYASEESEPQNGWVETTDGKKYMENGIAVKGLSVIGNKTYVFNSKGILQINKWTSIDGIKYCSDSKGMLVRDKVVNRKGHDYYVKSDGTALKNSWKTLKNGKTCYFGSNGVRYTGIRKVDGQTYGFSIHSGYLMKNSWIKKEGKVYRTDSAGAIFKDKLIKVDGKYYYLGSNGVRYISKWKIFAEGKSYFNAKGYRVSGEQKIEKKTYYFSKKGYLVIGKKSLTEGSTTYYLDGNGLVEMKVKSTGSKNQYYNTSGKELSEVQARNYLTLQTAKGIAAKITNASMSKEQKLRACFEWVIKKPYVTRRPFSNFEGWPAVFANDHFIYGGGNCHSDAGAFAYLAKAIGYKEVYVCTDSAGADGHSWCEIGGKVYDPLFAEAKKNYAVYYGGTYASYVLQPILHIAI